MRKSRVKKRSQMRRRPLYFVDNPNKQELNWLDELQRTSSKPVIVHTAATVGESQLSTSEYQSSLQQTEEIVSIANAQSDDTTRTHVRANDPYDMDTDELEAEIASYTSKSQGEPFKVIPIASPDGELSYGIQRFAFRSSAESVRVIIPFQVPFANLGYVIVAMTDHPSCSCILRSKKTNEAELEVIRTRWGTTSPVGTIQWMAVGHKTIG